MAKNQSKSRARGKPKGALPGLAQREQQIMDLLYQLSPSTAAELEEALSGTLANATIRTTLRSLERKGYVRHRLDGATYVYEPTTDSDTAAKKDFRRIVKTFFSGSTASAVATLIAGDRDGLSDAELAELQRLIDTHRSQQK